MKFFRTIVDLYFLAMKKHGGGGATLAPSKLKNTSKLCLVQLLLVLQ